MNFLKARVYAMAAFTVAAKNEAPDAVRWTRRVLGLNREIPDASRLAATVSGIFAPKSDLVDRERMIASQSTKMNRIMTGLRICAAGSERVTATEHACLMEFFAYIGPVVERMSKNSQAELYRYMDARRDMLLIGVDKEAEEAA